VGNKKEVLKNKKVYGFSNGTFEPRHALNIKACKYCAALCLMVIIRDEFMVKPT